MRSLWQGETLDRAAGRALLLVAGAAFLVQATGLGHEIGGLYFADEGTFLAEARRINAERALRPWFVYPHFLFYWDALALWVADLCGPIVPAIARRLWGVAGELNVAALVTRCASSTLAALSTVPVFLAARRLALGSDDAPRPQAALTGLAAAALLALSPTMVEVGQLNISDVPAAFFAACTAYGVSLLVERESTRRFLLTGLAAGLAAGSKYPAGLVAVAIAAVWLRGVFTRRRLGPGLVWAGLAALAAFVLTTPSFLRFPGAAFGGEGQADVLFGARLYSKAAWQGIVRESNAIYYLKELRHAFGWPALALGIVGLAALARDARRRIAWLLPFPVAFLATLLALQVALRRNLMPVVPFLAIVLGSGLAGLLGWCAARWQRRSLAAAGLVALLALPAAATAALLVRHSRPTTRDTAAAWMRQHLPPGSFLVQEQYTPLVGPEELFPARRPRFAARLEPAVLRDARHDYLLLSSEAYQRFLTPDNLENLANDVIARRYREIFDSYPLVREWTAGRFQDGPTLRLYRLDPEAVDMADTRRLGIDEVHVSARQMRTGDGQIAFSHAGEWALVKTYLAAGAYQVRIAGSAAPAGRLRLRTREEETETVAPLAGGEGRLRVGHPAKVFLYLELEPGSRIAALEITAVGYNRRQLR